MSALGRSGHRARIANQSLVTQRGISVVCVDGGPRTFIVPSGNIIPIVSFQFMQPTSGDKREPLMEALRNVDWLTLVIGVFLGVPVAYVIGILAHMHTPKVVQFLENRKLVKRYKTRQQALVVFNRIKSFHERRGDRYASYILLSTRYVLSGLLASILFGILFNYVRDTPIDVGDAIILILATTGALMAALLSTGIYETARQLERFDDYKNEFEERWGPVNGA